MEDFSGITAYAQYTNFRVEDESTNYVLRIGDYSGTAGNVTRHSLNYRFMGSPNFL